MSEHFAAEYYGAPDPSDPDYTTKFEAFFKTLPPDTVLPPGLTPDEEREASRALKGSMLRQEVYADVHRTEHPKKYQARQHPYSVTEQNFTIEVLQPQA